MLTTDETESFGLETDIDSALGRPITGDRWGLMEIWISGVFDVPTARRSCDRMIYLFLNTD